MNCRNFPPSRMPVRIVKRDYRSFDIRIAYIIEVSKTATIFFIEFLFQNS